MKLSMFILKKRFFLKFISGRKNTAQNRAVFSEKKSVAAHAATPFEQSSTKGGRAGEVGFKAVLRLICK